MVDRQSALRARAPLEAARPGVSVEEVTDLALVTIALPVETALADGGPSEGDASGASSGTASVTVRTRLERAFELTLPALGESVANAHGERLLGLQSDRLFVLFHAAGDDDPERALLTRLDARQRTAAGQDATVTDDARDTTATADGTEASALLYSSDQSDAWAMLRIDGSRSRLALERLCPLDLHPSAFAVGAVARSIVEHLGLIVLREGENAFLLFSPRSSAHAFLHEIETAARHVGNPR